MIRNVKMCALCDNRIPYTHVVCPTHYKEYKLYKNEQWFLELVESQRKQAIIDAKEIVTTSKLSERILSRLLSRKLRRENSLPKAIIIEMYNKGMRPFQIARELHIPANKIRVVISRHKRNGTTK